MFRTSRKCVVRSSLFVALGVLLVGCGDPDKGSTSAIPEVQPLSWQPLPDDLTPLSAIGDNGHYLEKMGVYVRTAAEGAVQYGASGSAGTDIKVRDRRSKPWQVYSMPSGLSNFSYLRLGKTLGGTVYLLALGSTGTAPGNPTGALRVFSDSNSNGRIDPSDSAVTISDGSPSASWGSHWRHMRQIGSTWYVLDSRMQRIRRITDSNADGIPNTLHSAAFLDTTQTHELEDVNYLSENSAGDLELLTEMSPVGFSKPGTSVMCVRDADSNGIADEYEMVEAPLWADDIAPKVFDRPDSDDTSISIAGAPGTSVELWKLGPDDVLDEQLASGSIPSGETRVAVSISAALAAGTRIAVRITGESEIGPVATIAGPQARLTSMSPVVVTSTVDTLTVTGDGFNSLTQVRLVDPEPGTGLSGYFPTVTVVSSTELTVAIYDLSSEPGSWELDLLHDGKLVGTLRFDVLGE